ncbi:CoA pyrophosphatase [Pinisolibacter sp.]|uniref:CoA pyrophosphatase n=1 Tax=Pinisolibacter sp. TaxID=2172024 RepID=UPI003FA7E728
MRSAEAVGVESFRAEAFVERVRPHFVVDPLAVPFDAGGSDLTLNPSFAAQMVGRRLKDAAVLIGLVDEPHETRVILTQRTEHLSSHAGQVAFPGGKIDAEDGSAIETALREAEEEIGLDRAHVLPVGCLPPYASGSGYRIVPVIALVRPGLSYAPNPHEVADVFEVPLAFLMTGANHRVGSRVWNGRTGYFYEMPYGERYIWGVTAGIIRQIWERTYGRTERTVEAGA